MALSELVQQGKFTEAYELLKGSPEPTASYYYNLGTLGLRAGKSGEAYAALLKASALSPNDPDISANLEIAKNIFSRALGSESRLDPAGNWAHELSTHVSLSETRGVLGALGLLLLFFWARSYIKKRNLFQMFRDPASVFCGIGLLLTMSIYGVIRYSEQSSPVVVARVAELRSGPGERFSALGKIDAGITVRLEAPSPTNDWYQVRYGPEQIGWIPCSSVLLLSPQ